MDNYSTKYCPNCGCELPADAVFCGTCGYNFVEQGGEQAYGEQQYYNGEQQGYDAQQQYYGEQQGYDAQQQYYGEQPNYDAQQQYYGNQQGYDAQQQYYGNQQGYDAQQQYYGNQQGYDAQQQYYGTYPPKKNGGGAKILIIIISIILALALIGVGVYFFFFYDGGTASKDALPQNANQATQTAAPTASPTASPNVTPTPVPTATPVPNGGYVLPDSNTRELTTADLVGLNQQQLMIARNEIYARHGRQFQTDWLQQYFNSCPWYVVNLNYNYNDENSMINAVELKNATLILEYEKSLGYQ
jgi:hypothetical protein